MASSTTMPIARTSPNSVRLLRLKPATYMATKNGERHLKSLAAFGRRLADLPHGDLQVLLAESGDHVLHGQVAGRQFVGIDPDPHRVISLAEDQHLADAGEPSQLILDVQHG